MPLKVACRRAAHHWLSCGSPDAMIITSTPLAVAAEMLLRVEQTDDRFYETELYRLQGELQRYPNARVQADAAETSLSQALAHHPPPRGEVL